MWRRPTRRGPSDGGLGAAWGVYSLRGRRAGDPVGASAGNFLRAVPLALGLATLIGFQGSLQLDATGLGYAVLSGAVTSGLGYVAWYAVLPALRASSAATVQLSVPVLAALGGVMVVNEPITLRLALASVATLGGIALVLRAQSSPARAGERSHPPHGSE